MPRGLSRGRIGVVPYGTRSGLHAEPAANLRFDAIVSLTDAKMKEYGVPGIALGVVSGGDERVLRRIGNEFR